MNVRPAIAGVAELANKDEDRIVHPITLIEEAARAALDEAGIDASHIGGVWSPPLSIFSEEDGASMLAERLDLPPGARHRSGYSGAGPLTQLSEACAAIAAGDMVAALVAGGIADASVRRARRRGIEPPAPPTSIWSQGSDGPGEHNIDRRRWERGWAAEVGAGCAMPSSLFAVVESTLAVQAGRTPDEQRAWLGELMAPFTEVAASRPELAWFPEARRPDEISGIGPDNRFVAEPYTKLLCSFPTVDLAAAVVVVSSDLLTGEGVHPLAIAKGSEAGMPSWRPRMHETPSLSRAAARALDAAGITPDDIEAFDFYSCFPAAVQLGMAAFGLGADDPRPRTLTGGLPYFGGPGAAYTLHGIVTAVRRARTNGGRPTAAVGVGGAFHDFAVGLFSVDAPSRPQRFELEPTIADEDLVPVTRVADGPGVVEAATILHERDLGAVEAPVLVRLPDGSRIGARAADPALPAALSRTPLVGREVELHAEGDRVTYELRD